MFNKHISRHLAAYIDGALDPRKTAATEAHLAICTDCCRQHESIRFAIAAVNDLPLVEAPATIWPSIEQASQQTRSTLFPRWQLALATIALAAVVSYLALKPSSPRWPVASLAGSRTPATIGPGEWLETNARSTASITVGEIGQLEVSPNTRLRILKTKPAEHRIALVHGEIHARISAPPKLFFVDTASGTAIDLGCEYSLRTDEDGSGILQVTKGWVSFQWNGLESLVPAGATCRTHPQLGPGLPYFDDASSSLKDAADNFGYEKTGNDPMGVILAAARVRDTLTLWHLLPRVDVADRALVFDRIVALTPLPAGISRDQVLKLDPETLKRWKDELAWTW